MIFFNEVRYIHKIKPYLEKSILPLLILISVLMMNIQKIDVSIYNFLLHVIFQFLLTYSIYVYIRNNFICKLLFSMFISLSVVLELAYGEYLSVGVMMSVMSTTFQEGISFLKFNILAILFVSLFIFYASFYKATEHKILSKYILIIGLSYLVIPTIVSAKKITQSHVYDIHIKSGLARGYSSGYAKFEYWLTEELGWRYPALRSIRGISDTIIFLNQKVNVKSSWKNVQVAIDSPGILVLGIGESVRAGNMGIYGYARNTTPNLQKISKEIGVYTDAFSAGTTTWTSLPAVLTKSSRTPDLSKSVVNLAKDAGYITYWVSNQASAGTWDFSISSIAEQAHFSSFVSIKEGGSEYDEVLIEQLENILVNKKEKDKIFIVLHFYGSHMNFSERYPQQYNVFTEDSVLNQYDNSILYADFIQSEIIRIVKSYGGKYLFFSDHGLGDPDGEIPLKHDVRSDPVIDSLRVPLIFSSKNDSNISINKPVSLYYFECIFSGWSDITSTDLSDGGFCTKNLGRTESVDFISADLSLLTESIN
jgi:heptose-I-phosphate ethanolaminephosphotransferase